MKIKLNLLELKVQSFITSLEKAEEQTLKSGLNRKTPFHRIAPTGGEVTCNKSDVSDCALTAEENCR